MSVLVVGASGATGRLLTAQLLARGEKVGIVVRTTAGLPESILSHVNLDVTRASLLDLADDEMRDLVRGRKAVASCLGHNMTFKGMFGPPRRLVTDATRRLCLAIRETDPSQPVRFVLMNTTGNRNRDLDERLSWQHKSVVALLRLLLPPHVDNEQAAEFLRSRIGSGNGVVEWAAVRPDNLVDEADVSAYEVFPSPVRDAIFDSGRTSRINVAHFMAVLMTDDDNWRKWRGRMPVIYNADTVKADGSTPP